jgi:hypothetical protein
MAAAPLRRPVSHQICNGGGATNRLLFCLW